MEQLTTFNKILKYIQQYQQQSPRMKSFGYGDIVYFATTNSGTTEFPLVFVTPVGITYDENITTYNLSVIFGDIVNTDMSNEADVVSDMSLEAKRFIAEIKRGFLEDKIDVELPTLAQPFFERFNDHIGGVVLDINIIVNEYLDACLIYQPEPTPTVTPTPSPTSVTPTPTPTTTPTPTPSPNPKFDIGSGFSYRTDGVMIDSNDSVYVTAFQANYYDGTYIDNAVVKLNNDGSLDTNFVCKVNSSVVRVVDDGLGYLYLAGNFTLVNGNSCNRITRVDKSTGAVDSNWIGITGFNGVTFDVLVDGTDIIVVGGFSTFNGVSKNRIVKISNTGVLDTGAFYNFSNSTVYSVIKNRNGNYVVAGQQQNYNGITCSRIMEIDSTTYADTGLISAGFTDVSVRNIYQDSTSGDYFWVGNGGTINGLTARKINKVDEYFTTITALNLGGVPMNTCYYHEPTESLFGTYSQSQPSADYYFKVDCSGGGFSLDDPFNQNLKTVDLVTSNSPSLLQPAAVDSIGKVYFCGTFDRFNSNNNNYITRVNSDGTSNTQTN